MSENQTDEQDSGVGSSLRTELWELFKILVVSAAIVLPIRFFVVQPFVVRGPSMEPTFENREYLVVDELTYYRRPPVRDEVVVFRYPKDPSEFFIKRIIGLPGERIDIVGGQVKITNALHSSGAILDESYLTPPNRPTYPDAHWALGAEEYFVLGDNRDQSSDSRFWGPVGRKFLVGRVIFRAWPLARFGIIQNFAPAF